ncbi:hypothetical protein V7S43_015321 [Phytophthora oleae]|uniref:Uncharacterized protein n=1 Tax=Phytophthora oleae TaxID=2107226 RepID=A0ABD3EZE0_9STRA
MPLVNHTKEVDPELSRLSYEQRQLRQLIYNDHKQDVKALRTKRNRLLHRIQERSKALAGAFIDEKLAIIEQSNHSTQIFEATRALFRRRSLLTSLCDSTGKYILSRQEAGTKIKQHFQDQLSDPTRTPVANDGLKRPLNNPITAYELDSAFRRLRNGHATGPDSIPAELLKYGSELLAQPLADIINYGLTTGDNIHLGDGILLGLPSQTSRLANALAFDLSSYSTASVRRFLWWCFAASPPRSNDSCPRTKAGSDPVAALLMQCGPTGG